MTDAEEGSTAKAQDTTSASGVDGEARQAVAALRRMLSSHRPIYCDTEANWNAQASLIAEKGAIYVYSDHSRADGGSVPGIKIGDGTSFLIDMPFVADDIAEALGVHVSDTAVHITSEERAIWNNKVTAYLDGNDAENLILSKTASI